MWWEQAEGMNPQAPFKRLVLRAVLRNVCPMMIRVLGCARLPASMKSSAAFWVGMVWAASFAFTDRRSTVFAAEQVQATAGFQLRPQEKFLYTFGAIDLWEWELRLLDQEDVADTR